MTALISEIPMGNGQKMLVFDDGSYTFIPTDFDWPTTLPPRFTLGSGPPAFDIAAQQALATHQQRATTPQDRGSPNTERSVMELVELDHADSTRQGIVPPFFAVGSATHVVLEERYAQANENGRLPRRTPSGPGGPNPPRPPSVPSRRDYLNQRVTTPVRRKRTILSLLDREEPLETPVEDRAEARQRSRRQGRAHARRQQRVDERRALLRRRGARRSTLGFTRLSSLLSIIAIGGFASAIITADDPREISEIIVTTAAGALAQRILGRGAGLGLIASIPSDAASPSPEEEFQQQWQAHVDEIAQHLVHDLNRLHSFVEIDIADFEFEIQDDQSIMTADYREQEAQRLAQQLEVILEQLSDNLEQLSRSDLPKVRKLLVSYGANRDWVYRMIR